MGRKKFKDFLKSKFNGKIDPELVSLLPKGYNVIGDIAIVRIPEKLTEFKREIGEFLLEWEVKARSVACFTGVTGELRTPTGIEIIAGKNNFVTVHRELGCKFELDISKVLFCLGNHYERMRMIDVVKPSEIVIDMFAGVGQFTIPIAVHSKTERIWTIDKNPHAYSYLLKNIFLNSVENIVIPFWGDSYYIVPNLLSEKADRIIMGFIRGLDPSQRLCKDFLPGALKALKKEGGIIHFHEIFPQEDVFEKPIEIIREYALAEGRNVIEITYQGIIKTYAPKIVHVVVDAVIS